MRRGLLALLLWAIAAQGDITSDLVMHYKFDDNLNDSSGGSHNLSVNNVGTDISYTTGQVGNCAYFAASGDYASVDDFSGVDGFTNCTMACWVKRVNTGDVYSYCIIKSSGYRIVADNNDGEYMARLTDNDGTMYDIATTGDAAENTDWHHVCVTHNGTTVTLYIDGASAASGNPSSWSGTIVNNSNAVGVGGAIGGSGTNIYLDEVRIYSRCLSSTEVDDLYDYTGDSATPTNTTAPTLTFTPTYTDTATQTPTVPTPTFTGTPTFTATITDTPTATPTVPTPTPTVPTPTPTVPTPTFTGTHTFTPTFTPTVPTPTFSPTITNTPANGAANLVLHYPFDGDIQDASSGANHLTISGATAAYDTGMNGQALTLESSSDFTLPSATNIAALDGCSILFWAKKNNLNDSAAIVESDNFSFRFSTVNVGGLFYVYHSIGSVIDSGGGALTARETVSSEITDWHHYAFTYEQTSGETYLRFYYDGALVASPNTSSVTYTGVISGIENLSIGGIDGYIDDFRVYRSVLASDDIGDVIDAGATPTPTATVGPSMTQTPTPTVTPTSRPSSYVINSIRSPSVNGFEIKNVTGAVVSRYGRNSSRSEFYGLVGTASSQITVSSNTITVTKSFHQIQGATETISVIHGGQTGDIIRLIGSDGANITLQDGVSNIESGIDITLESSRDIVEYIYDGKRWMMIGHNQN